MNTFPQADQTARPWTRWWWMGNAVTTQEITRHLEAYKAAGIGGVEITPIYGVKGFEARSLQMLGPEWVEMVRHAIREGQRLGIGVDMTLGSGWPYGGSHLRENSSPQKLEVIEQDGKFSLRISPTGQKVKRAAPGGEGFVMCPYSAAAFERFIEPYGKMFAGDAVRPRSFFYDSFEVFGANFAAGLLDSFSRIKGYDLTDHLAALAGRDDPDHVARVRCDYRDVLFERLLDDGIKPWVAWAHARGISTRYQAHGSPGNLIDLYAAADIPETEVFGTSRFPWLNPGDHHPEIVDESYPVITKMASSAAHLTGKRLASSETFTWHREHFSGSFAEMKPEADQLFLAGINHLFFHGSTFSPADAPWPGWAFYASTHFDIAQPLWREMPAFSAYLAFCQELLQSGEIQSDLAVYFPFHDVISSPDGDLLKQLTVHGVKDFIREMDWGRIATGLWRESVPFDLFSDRLAGAVKHRIILVPPCRFMPLETMKTIIDQGRKGATIVVIGKGPESEPGMAGLRNRETFDAARTELLALATRAREEQLTGMLESLGTGRNPAGAPEGVRGLTILRNGELLHFVVNHSATNFEGWIKPRGNVPRARWKLVDPVRHRIGAAKMREGELFIQLVPGESIWLMPAGDGERPWFYAQSTGREIVLDAGWRIEAIEGGPVLPSQVTLDALRSWTGLSPEWRDFSGVARYSTEFDWDAGAPGTWLLTFPKVCEMVRVKLNGADLGTLWCPPTELEVTPYLRQGRNELVCEVTNLAINRIAAKDRRGEPWRIFHEINFVSVKYKPFDAADWPARDSGLIGAPLLRQAAPLKFD